MLERHKKKYSVLKIVTTALVLPRRNIDVECGFSVNKDLIGETQTCLTIGSINGFEEERLQKKNEEANKENKKRGKETCEKERQYLQEQQYH